jgi:hypothetical protein
MNTEMKDIHFASYADSVASHISWPSPAFRLTRWEAFVGTVITFVDARKMGSTFTRAVAIALCLGTLGCAGLGAQHASTLTARIGGGPGLGSLWMSAERSPAQGIEVLPYAGDDLGLWAESVTETRTHRAPHGDVLPASVTETWERVASDPCATVSTGSLFGDVHRGGRRGHRKGSARRSVRPEKDVFASKGTEL